MARIGNVISRRSLLKTTAAVSGAAAAAGLVGCAPQKKKDEQAQEAEAQNDSEGYFYSMCRGNCGGNCNLRATVRDGKLVNVQPTIVPEEARDAQRGCAKGHANPLRVYGGHRVKYPMRQRGERGSDNWERISWDEAMSLMVDKFKSAIEKDGSRSIAWAIGSGNTVGYLGGTIFYDPMTPKSLGGFGVGPVRFVQKMGPSVMFYSGDAAGYWMQWNQLLQPASSIEDVANAKVVFLWGHNPADADYGEWPFLCRAREAGTKIVTIDPLYSKTAAGSDIWVPIRTGTDGALMLAMCNYIIDNDLIDQEYFANGSTAPLLLKEDGSYLRLSDIGKDPIEIASATTGGETKVDTEVVYDLDSGQIVSSYESKNPAITGTFDMNGTQVRTVYDIVREAIKPFTIEYAAEECGLSIEMVTQLCELYATTKPAKIITDYGIEHMHNSWRVYFDLALLGSLSGNACIAGGGYSAGGGVKSEILSGPVTVGDPEPEVEDAKPIEGFTTEYLPQVMETGEWAGKKWPINCLFVQGSNILGSYAGASAMKEAMRKIDFVVVHDQFLTATAKEADLILPCTSSWEEEDFTGTFMMQKAIEPVGESKSNFELYVELAQAMGYDDLYNKDAEGYLRAYLDTPENIAAGRAYDDFHEQGCFFGEYMPAETTDLVEFNPTGRTQFYLEAMTPRDFYGQEFSMTDRMPYYEHALEAYKDNTEMLAKYPLYGLSHHDTFSGQTFQSHVPWITEIAGYEGEPYTLIHETAAAERGIATGDIVRVFNDHGYVVTRAVVTKGIREDTVLVPRGFDTDEYRDGHPQNLISVALDPVTSNNNLNDWLCQVEKVQ